jgi:hypothetical protein
VTQKKKFCKICPRQIPEEVRDRGALQAYRLTFTKKNWLRLRKMGGGSYNNFGGIFGAKNAILPNQILRWLEVITLDNEMRRF